MKNSLETATFVYIDTLIRKAAADGRDVLFEHEIYDILGRLNLNTPPYLFIENEEQLNPSAISMFNNKKVVLKIVSSDVTHKSAVKGVAVIHKDFEYIKYRVQKMREMFINKHICVKGILITDFIEHSQDLGNEVLLGFKESEAFGPVISFSKGGRDAEHFSKHFSPPNLILAPIDRKWALALLESTKIHEKYISEGKNDYFLKIVEAGIKLSMVATAFSNFFPSGSRFAIAEFEINPFVFDENGGFVALDGFARFTHKDPQLFKEGVAPVETMLPFFEPKGVAVVGVSSTDILNPGNIIYENLFKMGRKDLFAVNDKGGTFNILGKQIVLNRSITEITESLDLVIIAVPAKATMHIVKQCAKKGVKAIVLIPGGFSEIHKNKNVEEEISNLVMKENIRVIGPNCLGIIYAGKSGTTGINTFFIPENKFKLNLKKDSNVAMISQSGALGITEIYNLRNAISPRIVVSYGNQLDVDPVDLIQYLNQDEMVDIIACYIEGFKKGAGRRFFNSLSHIKKPVIIYKAGRTEAGRKATESHTASIAGEYEITKAAMKQAGVIVADKMLDHGEFLKTFALLKDFIVTGNRVAIIANAGYEKTYAADNLGGLVAAEFDQDTLTRLKTVLPPFVNAEPLLDLTPMATDKIFQECIDIVLQSDAVDAVFISIVPQSADILTTDDEIARYEENLASRIVHTVKKFRKPTVASINVVSGSDAIYNKFGQILDQGGIPTFLSANRAMKSLNAFIRYHLTKESLDYKEWLK